MAAEAEATDILIRVLMEGTEHCLKFTGAAASKGVALCMAGLRTVWEHERGKKKLGGKISPRTFIEGFSSSSFFTLSSEDLNKLKPEMKRLHINYMQYKSNKEMRENGQVDISVPGEAADRFTRLAKKLGIGVVSCDIKAEELSPAAYQLLSQSEGAQSVEATISENGVSIKENPTQAAADPGNLSAPSSRSTVIPAAPFDPSAGVDKNLMEAKAEAARRSGRLIPLSINKATLLEKTHYDTAGNLLGITVFVPGTQRHERLTIPRESIITMDADGGQTIRAELIDSKYYRQEDRGGPRNVSGREIRDSGRWDLPERRDKTRAPQTRNMDLPHGRIPQGR